MDLVKITEMIGKLGVDAKESFIYFLWINFSLEIVSFFLWGLFLVFMYKIISTLMLYVLSSNRYLIAINEIIEISGQEKSNNDRYSYIHDSTIKSMIKKLKKGFKCQS